MSKEFTCCDCKQTFTKVFDSSIPEFPLPEQCEDCFMKQINTEPELAAPEAA